MGTIATDYAATDITVAAQGDREWVTTFNRAGGTLGVDMIFTTTQSRDVSIVRRRGVNDFLIEKVSADASTKLTWRPEAGKEEPFAGGDKVVVQFSQAGGACSVNGVVYRRED